MKRTSPYIALAIIIIMFTNKTGYKTGPTQKSNPENSISDLFKNCRYT